MTEHHGPPRPDGDARTPQHERAGSLWSLLAPAAALLLGLVLGGVLVGVVVDDDESSPGARSSDSPSPGDPSVSPSAGATTVVVPDACLAAADSVEEALALARLGADAIRDFEPQELRELLRQLEELDLRARAQVKACREVQTTGASTP